MENKYQDLKINSESGMLEPYPQGEPKLSFEEIIELNKSLIEKISKVPVSAFENLDPNSTGFVGKYNMGNNPCDNCPNNPKNNPFSSGFCNCAIPALTNPMY